MTKTLVAAVGFLLVAVLAAAAPSAREAASAAPLKLGPDLVAKAEAYAQDAEKVKTSADDAKLCALMRKADELGRALAEPIGAAWDGSKDAAAFTKAQAALLAALPGVEVELHAAGPDGKIGYKSMGNFAKDKHWAASRLLIAAGELVDDMTPAYTTMLTDDQGCTDYRPAQEATERIAAAWVVAPACVKDALRPSLSKAIADAPSTCFCKSKAEAARDADKFAVPLKRLKDLGGPAAAAAIKGKLNSKDARFQCAPN